MNRCPITYEFCSNQKYSKKGLHLLSPKLKELKDFPFTAKEQRELALEQASKLSIQGMQFKLSAKLSFPNETFELIERKGTFILKPPHQVYDEVPQNEDLTMRLAKTVDLEVPLHGMIYNKDGSLTYFIKRFDRLPRGHKIAVEDFTQVLGYSRETKYESSMEKLISAIEQKCTFPLIEKLKLFRLTLFNLLVGNDDAHLKNFSLITRAGKVEMSPVYDLLNSTLIIKSGEESALPLRGKKSNFKCADVFDYFGKERLGLATAIVEQEMERFTKALPKWKFLLEQSFLSLDLQEAYWKIIEARSQRFFT
ncbi:MAG: HipA domain-containing protein [Simkania negevensis]|nr:HipA domain-containing protein [Simkania negevensis]